MGSAQISDDTPTTVNLTPEQRRAIRGLSSNVKGLIHCVNHRIKEQQSKVPVTTGHRDRSSLPSEIEETRGSISPPKMRSSGDLLVGPEHLRRKSSGRATVFSRNMFTIQDSTVAPLPQELLRDLMESDSITASKRAKRKTDPTTASYLAHEYGGLELPKKFTVQNEGARRPRMTMKEFSKVVSDANSFVSMVKRQGSVDKDELEYLPHEFARLGLGERRKLAKMLRWENLREWGFDSFEVNRLSTVTKQALLNNVGMSQGSIIEVLDSSSSQRGLDSSEWSGVDATKQGCPLVLIGWAVLSSPYSQLAMARDVNDNEMMESAWAAIKQRANTTRAAMARKMIESKEDGTDEKSADGAGVSTTAGDDAWNGGYFVPDEFEVCPRAIASFLRRVEAEYSTRSVNPYHNNLHAADVVQSTHALIQMGGGDMEMAYTPLETYSILLAAACHDIRHPGTNNNYQVNARTELSLIYNDKSVLENMHASRASCLLEGVEFDDLQGGSVEGDGGDHAIFGKMTKEQRVSFRTSLTRAILSTDMSNHFWVMAKVKGYVEALEEEIALEEKSPPPSLLSRIGGKKHHKLRDKFLPFLLHLADISNPAKPHDISLEWTKGVYDEFFLQGDKEAAEDLPVSPLCDRSTTVLPEAQVGFMRFVVQPAFELLAEMIPKVEDVLLSELEKNLEHWEAEKAKVAPRT